MCSEKITTISNDDQILTHLVLNPKIKERNETFFFIFLFNLISGKCIIKLILYTIFYRLTPSNELRKRTITI